MDQFERLFTPEEANQLLDSLRPLVDQLVEARDQVSELRPDLAGALQNGINYGGSAATRRVL